MFFFRCRPFFFCALFLIPFPLYAETSYNEVYESNGSLRKPYESALRLWNPQLFNVSDSQIGDLENRPLNDKIKIFHLPWVVERKEYEQLREDVAERAIALQKFFRDIFVLKNYDVLQAVGLPLSLLKEIAWDSGFSLAHAQYLWKNRLDLDIRFMYGPDIIRNAQGRWEILEDNMGSIGGIGDLHFLRQAFHKTHRISTQPPPIDDLVLTVKQFLDETQLPPQKIRGLLELDLPSKVLTPDQMDLENTRIQHTLLTKLGIETWTMKNFTASQWLQLSWGAVRGFINFSSGKNKLQINDLFFGQFFLLGRKHQHLLSSPYTDILGNKTLLCYTDKIVEYYTGRIPKLKTSKTLLIGHEDISSFLEREGSEWVIKPANGLQGRDVFIVPHLDHLLGLKEAMVNHPSLWVAQKFSPLSHIPLGTSRMNAQKWQLDMRTITFVGSSGAYVWKTSWGRSSPLERHSLNNVSKGAKELYVHIQDCEENLQNNP